MLLDRLLLPMLFTPLGYWIHTSSARRTVPPARGDLYTDDRMVLCRVGLGEPGARCELL